MIYDELEEYFKENGFVWNIDGEHKVPDAIDIQMVVDKAVAVLYDEPLGSILEVGRLIVQKSTNKTYDIFVHFGTTV